MTFSELQCISETQQEVAVRNVKVNLLNFVPEWAYDWTKYTYMKESSR